MNSAAVATPPRMILHSELLGTLEIAEEDVLYFAGGLFGFPECRNFVLLPAARDGVFWLQSTDHPALAFLLADPFHFVDGYLVDLSMADRIDLGVETPADILVLAIVTLPRSRADHPTANLQGPLAMNIAARRGKQLALAESKFGIRCPIDLSS